MNLLFPNSESGIFFPSTSIICISANSFGILSVTTVSNGKDNINEEPPSILFSNDKVPWWASAKDLANAKPIPVPVDVATGSSGNW